MGSLFSRLVIIALIQCYSYALMAHVMLDYPVGGETFNWGETVNIQWHITIPHTTINWDLYFSSDGGATWAAIQLNIPTSQLSYNWVVPDTLTSMARIKIFMDNADQDMDYVDISPFFTLEPLLLPPTLDVPAMDATIECNVANQQTAIQAWLNSQGGALVTNYCGDLTWTNDFNGLTNGCGATGSAVVNFTATDECGSTETNAVLTIVDTEAPVMNLPAADLVVNCNGSGNLVELNNWLNNHGGAQASDACSNVIWTNNFTNLSNGCGLTGSTTVTFAAIDACGNNNITTATFTIRDIAAPIINVAANNLISTCGDPNQGINIQNWLTNHGGANASDFCGSVIWTNNFSTLSDGCGATGNAIVTFTATDECGNSSTTNATINIIDTTVPRIDAIALDTTLQCGSSDQESVIQSWLNNHGGALASDACGNVSWSHNYSNLSDGCASTGNALVTFTASDECGNSAIVSAMITIDDHVAPVIETMARDTSIECGRADQENIIQSWLDNYGGARANDQCGNVTWSNDFSGIQDTCSVETSKQIIFSVSDECGNSSTTQARFTIRGPLGINTSNIQQLNFKIFPNPVSDILTIQFDKSESIETNFSLFDTYGNLLWSGKNDDNDLLIPVSNYPSGVYFLQASTSLGVVSQKVMIE